MQMYQFLYILLIKLAKLIAAEQISTASNSISSAI